MVAIVLMHACIAAFSAVCDFLSALPRPRSLAAAETAVAAMPVRILNCNQNRSDESDSGMDPDNGPALLAKWWTCDVCDGSEVVDTNVNTARVWQCRRQGVSFSSCTCGGKIEGHEKHGVDTCRESYTCNGLMIFSPRSTSLFGDGLLTVAHSLTEAELENRFEGRCIECGQHGKFNEVAQQCSCIGCRGIMVMEKDHMPSKREGIGEIAKERNMKKTLMKLEVQRRVRKREIYCSPLGHWSVC